MNSSLAIVGAVAWGITFVVVETRYKNGKLNFRPISDDITSCCRATDCNHRFVLNHDKLSSLQSWS
jgi:hypothetical protein